jgi:hypothetical protein
VLVVPMGIVNFVGDAWERKRIGLFDALREYRL